MWWRYTPESRHLQTFSPSLAGPSPTCQRLIYLWGTCWLVTFAVPCMTYSWSNVVFLLNNSWQNLSCYSERLKANGEQLDLLPHVLLRKYIAYARKYVASPRLSAQAAQVLQHFYLELRRQHQTQDTTPVTTRQLESLIRLTQVVWVQLYMVWIRTRKFV